jgi:hypothetical protein
MTTKWKLILSGIALMAVFTAGIFSKGKIDSVLQGANIGGTTTENTGGDKIGGDKEIGGDKIGGGDNAGGDQSKNNRIGGDNIGGDQTTQQGGINTVSAEPGSHVQIVIQPGDERYKNSAQPNLSASSLAEVKAVELSNFKGANPFTQDLVLQDYVGFIQFSDDKIAISDRIYKSIFRLPGDIKERKVVFSLSGNQKGIFLQFGVKDLPSKEDNVIYDVSVFIGNDADTKKVWSGKVVYGSKEQIISLPFDATNAKSLVIKYSIAQGSNSRGLYFTRAELLYE